MIVTFEGYGVNSRPVSIVASQIMHWSLIDYNGNYGTKIYLTDGSQVTVCVWPIDVEKAVREALKGNR